MTDFVAERRRMSPARRERILARFHGVCVVRDCGVTAGLEIDHIVPLALGGSDSDSNLEPRCYVHHKQKTREDVARIAKAKRQSECVGPREQSKRPIQSREFQKGVSRPLQSRPFQRKP